MQTHVAVLLLSFFVLLGISSNAWAGDKFKLDLNDIQLFIDLGHHDDYKKHAHKKHHRKKHKEHRRYASNKHYTEEMYCDEHRVYHHHHQDTHHSHDYGKRHHSHHDHHSEDSSYQMSGYHDYTSHCWPVQKHAYWNGRKALVGGKMCRDSGGNSYVIPSSRYLIKYRGYR